MLSLETRSTCNSYNDYLHQGMWNGYSSHGDVHMLSRYTEEEDHDMQASVSDNQNHQLYNIQLIVRDIQQYFRANQNQYS